MVKRIKFYSRNTYLLHPKPKSSLRHLKQGIKEFRRKYVLVCNQLCFCLSVTLYQYFKAGKNNRKAMLNRNRSNQKANGITAYEEMSTDDKFVVNSHLNELPLSEFLTSLPYCCKISSHPVNETVYERPRKICFGLLVFRLVQIVLLCS